MKIKTSELIGAQLDWAVALTEGWEPDRPQDGQLKRKWLGVYLVIVAGNNLDVHPANRYSPSTDWSKGGPLIEKYKVAIVYHNGQDLTPMATTHDRHPAFQAGDTILIAAMRAIVAAKLGEEIEVPEELV